VLKTIYFDREVNLLKEVNKEPFLDIKKTMLKVKDRHEKLKKQASTKKKEEKK